ncbi:MAG: hypothetical protein IT447_08685 [Phycisphaerales bacterium]|nr:hypothetical protein [Phycisphaerales bacterium]
MKHGKNLCSMMLCLFMAAPMALADDRPGPPPPPTGMPELHPDRPPPPDEDYGGRGRNDRPDRDRDNGMRRMPPEMAQLEMLRGYIDVVGRLAQLAKDPSAAGVAAVIVANDALKKQGPTALIAFFSEILPDVKDPAIARAIRIQLADAYKNAGKPDEALKQLRILMTSQEVAGNAEKKQE